MLGPQVPSLPAPPPVCAWFGGHSLLREEVCETRVSEGAPIPRSRWRPGPSLPDALLERGPCGGGGFLPGGWCPSRLRSLQLPPSLLPGAPRPLLSPLDRGTCPIWIPHLFAYILGGVFHLTLCDLGLVFKTLCFMDTLSSLCAGIMEFLGSLCPVGGFLTSSGVPRVGPGMGHRGPAAGGWAGGEGSPLSLPQ